MTSGKTLHLQTLIEKKAIISQVNVFRANLGESAEITRSLCVGIVDEFDFEWAVRNLLDETALKSYENAIAPARKVYLSPTVVVGDQTYCEAITQVLKVFDGARALAFADAYNLSSEG